MLPKQPNVNNTSGSSQTINSTTTNMKVSSHTINLGSTDSSSPLDHTRSQSPLTSPSHIRSRHSRLLQATTWTPASPSPTGHVASSISSISSSYTPTQPIHFSQPSSPSPTNHHPRHVRSPTVNQLRRAPSPPVNHNRPGLSSNIDRHRRAPSPPVDHNRPGLSSNVDHHRRAPSPPVNRNRPGFSLNVDRHRPFPSPPVNCNRSSFSSNVNRKRRAESSTSDTYSTSSNNPPSLLVDKNNFPLSINVSLNIVDRKNGKLFSNANDANEVLLKLKNQYTDINQPGCSRDHILPSPLPSRSSFTRRPGNRRLTRSCRHSSYLARRRRRQRSSSSSSESSSSRAYCSSCSRTKNSSGSYRYRSRSRNRNLLQKGREQITPPVRTHAETNRIFFAPLNPVPKACRVVKGIVNPLPHIITTAANTSGNSTHTTSVNTTAVSTAYRPLSVTTSITNLSTSSSESSSSRGSRSSSSSTNRSNNNSNSLSYRSNSGDEVVDPIDHNQFIRLLRERTRNHQQELDGNPNLPNRDHLISILQVTHNLIALLNQWIQYQRRRQ